MTRPEPPAPGPPRGTAPDGSVPPRGRVGRRGVWPAAALLGLALADCTTVAEERPRCEPPERTGVLPPEIPESSGVAASPISHVRRDAPPFLILYGFRDLAIQGEMLHMRLKAAGAPSRLVVIPGAGHGLAAVAGTGDLMAEFLRERLVE
jgi:acetyl esterase/lipase